MPFMLECNILLQSDIIPVIIIVVLVLIVGLALGWQQQLQRRIWRRTASAAPISAEWYMATYGLSSTNISRMVHGDVRPQQHQYQQKSVSITNIAAPLSAHLTVFGLPALIPFYTDELSIC
jgi:hypothetical protein